MTRILDTYDPNWQSRIADINRRLEEVQAKPDSPCRQAEIQALEAAVGTAFHAQFETVAAYRDWLFGLVREQSELDGIAFLMPVLSDDCSIADVDRTYGVVVNSIDRRKNAKEKSLPTVTLPADSLFGNPLSSGETRECFVFDHQNFIGAMSQCGVMIEWRRASAAVCFTQLPDPVNMEPLSQIEHLATLFYNDRLRSSYAPEQINFFVHSPAGRDVSEAFILVELDWHVETRRFHNPVFDYQTHLPSLLREAGRAYLSDKAQFDRGKLGQRQPQLRLVEP